MHLEDLRYITTIADLKSVTAAAQQLYVAQPSLSQHIKQVERNYNVTIFNRHSRGVTLTPEGERIVKWAKEVLAGEAELRSELANMKQDVEQRVSIGLPRYILKMPSFQTFVRSLKKENASLNINIVVSNSQGLAEMLNDGMVDISVTALPTDHEAYDHDVLFQEEFVFLPSQTPEVKAYVEEKAFLENGEKTISPDILNGMTLATTHKDSVVTKFINETLTTYGLTCPVKHGCHNTTVLVDFAMAGIASIFGGEHLIRSLGITDYYHLKAEKTRYPMVLLWKKGKKKSNLMERMMNFIIDLDFGELWEMDSI